MKSIYPYALLGALFAVGAVNAATTTTTPVGYTTATLVQGFNNVGVTLHSPIVATGTVTAVSATQVTASASNFTSLAAGTYILEVTSGTSTTGLTAEVNVTDATNLQTAENLSTAGVAAGTTFQLRKAATFEDVFGTTGSVLKKAASVASADVVWVPDGKGGYTRYFQIVNGSWKNATANLASPNTPLVYLDGIFIEKKDAGSVTLTITGEVKKVATSEALVTGFNYISTVYPVGTTLQNSGIDSGLAHAASVANADVVWVPAATPGSYTRYFAQGSGTTTTAWRNATANTTVTADVPLTTAVFIERKATSTAPASVKLTPPTAYASL